MYRLPTHLYSNALDYSLFLYTRFIACHPFSLEEEIAPPV